MNKVLRALVISGIWLLIFGAIEMIALWLYGQKALITAFWISFIWASTIAMFLYEKLYGEPKLQYDYQPNLKYIDIFEKDGLSFYMRHDGRSVVFNVINRKSLRELYVYDNHMSGSHVHADGVRVCYANLMAGYLTIKRIENGYRVSWEDDAPWELV